MKTRARFWVIPYLFNLSLFPDGTLWTQATISWNGSAGDQDWINAVNHNSAITPGPSNVARFDFGPTAIVAGPAVAPPPILLRGDASLTFSADASVGYLAAGQHSVAFGNETLTVNEGFTLTIVAPSVTNTSASFTGTAARTITNAGTICIIGGNNPNIVQNGNFAVIDVGGTYFADMDEVSYRHYSSQSGNGVDCGVSGAVGALATTGWTDSIPVVHLKRHTERMAGGDSYSVAVDNYRGQLPMLLTSNPGEAKESSIALEWTSLSEEKNGVLEVEQPTSASTYRSVGRVSGQATSSPMQTYSSVDNSPHHGTNVYWLRWVDFGGTQAYSELITLRVAESVSDEGWAYPTLVRNEDLINLGLPTKTGQPPTVNLIVASGQVSQYLAQPKGPFNSPLRCPPACTSYMLEILRLGPRRLQSITSGLL